MIPGKQKVIGSILWSLGGNMFSQLFTWVFTFLIARILSPADYGLVGISGIYMLLASFINDMGIGAAIIQKKDITEEEVETIYSFSLILSLVLAGFTLLIAKPYADFFNEPKIAELLRVYSITFILSSATSIQLNLLTRDMKFKEMAYFEVISRIISILSGYFSAVTGFGVWTLVVQHIVFQAVSFICQFQACRQMPGKISFGRIKKIFPLIKFGLNVMTSKIMFYFYRNIDLFLIGKFIGKDFLGSYSLAGTLADKPFEKLISVLNKVFFPFFSKVKDDKENVKNFFLKKFKLEILLIVPIFAGISLISKDIILVFLGEKWKDAILPLQIISAVGIFRFIDNIASTIAISLGYPSFQRNYILALFIVVGGSMFLLIKKMGINGIYISWLCIYVPMSCLYFYLFLRKIEVPFSSVMMQSMRIVYCLIIMIAVVMGLNFYFQYTTVFTLLVKVLVGIISYFISVFIIDKEGFDEVKDIILHSQSLISGRKL
ncbi:MAG: polysaccharide biosynthesis protein [uncultured bacterium]|nr:MAG: polysaccharide biosynthesis protein [uncultured bacterium]